MIPGPLEEDCCRDRISGFNTCLTQEKIEVDPEKIIEGDWSATSGYQAVKSLLKNEIKFSAIFAQNDRMAVGAIRALHEAGKSVPRDVSVIGFDDMPLASYFDPGLTTIRQDTFSMGREAARLLIRAIENPEKQRKHAKMPVELIVRNSTAVFKQ
jgi:DNA-binding LacI/PurR family transcriptional regulator